MRRCVLTLLVIVASLGLISCSQGAPGAVQGAPELLRAVPSDALCAGLFSRTDHLLDRMTDSASVFRRLDYGRLERSRAAYALCDVGSTAGLLIIEAGRSDADTLEPVRALMSMADSLKLSSALLDIDAHKVLLLSPSATVITVARRHVGAESSILDAPGFDKVLELLPQADAVVLRNRGAVPPRDFSFGPFGPKAVASFVRDAADWTVLSGGQLYPVVPDAGRCFCNFMEPLAPGQSKLASFFPEGASAVVDIPVASLQQWRDSYKAWLDARVELESYEKRISSLAKAAGKNPHDWEKELGVKELACVMMPGGTLNMVRTSKSAASEGVRKNPCKGFVHALYGQVFNPADSCMLRSGNWIISGDRALLDSLRTAAEKPAGWPASAKVVAWTPGAYVKWTNEGIKIWTSNQ